MYRVGGLNRRQACALAFADRKSAAAAVASWARLLDTTNSTFRCCREDADGQHQ